MTYRDPARLTVPRIIEAYAVACMSHDKIPYNALGMSVLSNAMSARLTEPCVVEPYRTEERGLRVRFPNRGQAFLVEHIVGQTVITEEQ